MSLFTFPHVMFLLVAVLLGLAAVFAMATRQAAMKRTPGPAHHTQASTSHRGAPKTHRLGGIIAGLITKDTGPPARVATTLLQDADEELPAPFAAVPCPAPGDAGGYAEYMRHISELTGTTTGMEQTGQWRAPTPEEIAAAAKTEVAASDPAPAPEPEPAPEPGTAPQPEPAPGPDPAPEPEADPAPAPEPEPALVGAPAPMELDGKAEQAMQRFEDAHRAEVEAAGDTTAQDQRDWVTGGDL